MISKKFNVVYLLPLLTVLMTGCDSTEDDWKQANKDNTVGAYQQFIKNHPQSAYAQEALSKGEVLAWRQASQDKSIKAYNAYLANYPEEKHKSEMYVSFTKEWFLPPENPDKLKDAKYKMSPANISGSGPQQTKKNYMNKYVFMPTDGYKVTGEVKTSLGPVEKLAKFGSWTYVYTDSAKKDIMDFGDCVTSGELIIPLKHFTLPLEEEGYIDNRFSAKLLSDKTLLLTFSAEDKSKLCFVPYNHTSYTSVSIKFDGTVITTAKGVFTRVKDKWRYMPLAKKG